MLLPIGQKRAGLDCVSSPASDGVGVPFHSSKSGYPLDSSYFLPPPPSVYVFGMQIGPRPLMILDQSQPVTRAMQRNEMEEEQEPAGLRKYEPLLRELQWKHGVVYVPLPVPASFVTSSPGADGFSLDESKREEDRGKGVEEEVPMDLIGASCERVRMVLDMLDIRWTHFLTYSYGALVAARMAASPISPSSSPFPLSPFASHSYAHRVGTILLLDTPLVTNELVDSFHRRRELYLGALDVNIPLSDLKVAKKMIVDHLEDPLPTPCAADKALYEQYLFEPSFTFPSSSFSSSSLSSLQSGTKEVEGMKVLVEEEQHEQHDDKDCEEEADGGQAVHRNSPKGKEETKGEGDSTAKCRGLFRCDQRYIPMSHFVMNFAHPMELITPAEDAVAEVDIFKKMFGMSRRTAVIKSAKRWPESARPTTGTEKKSRENGAAAASSSKPAAGKTGMEKEGESDVVLPDGAQIVRGKESLLFERMQHESEANTLSCSPISGTPPNMNASSFSEGALDEEGKQTTLPLSQRSAGGRHDHPKDSSRGPSPTSPEASSTGGSVTAEVCHVIRTWMNRYEPDVYISQQFMQRMGEMKQLLDAGGSSTGGDLVKKTKDQTKEKKKKEKKKK